MKKCSFVVSLFKLTKVQNLASYSFFLRSRILETRPMPIWTLMTGLVLSFCKKNVF